MRNVFLLPMADPGLNVFEERLFSPGSDGLALPKGELLLNPLELGGEDMPPNADVFPGALS